MRIVFLILFYSVIMACRAQIEFRPKWKKDDTLKLKYSYSKIQFSNDTLVRFDSAQSLIDASYLGADDSSYYFQWAIHGTYIDTARNRLNVLDKLSIESMYRAANRCPIKFKVNKRSFKVRLANESQIDSVIALVNDEINSEHTGVPKDTIDELTALRHTFFGGSSLFKATFRSIMEEYFDVYKKKEMIPNQRIEISHVKEWYSWPNAIGYSLLRDNDFKEYTWVLRDTVDMAKMVGPMMDALVIADSVQKAETKTQWTRPKYSQMSTMDVDVHISKPDMIVTSLYCVKGNDIKVDGVPSKTRESTLLEVMK